MNINRGEIYYVQIPYSTGMEMCKNRPGVVLSCENAVEDGCVSVIYTSASCRRSSPYHVTLNSTPVESTAYCEHVYTVDASRIGTRIGSVTPEELRLLERAVTLALGVSAEAPPVADDAQLEDMRRDRDLHILLYDSLVEKLRRSL